MFRITFSFFIKALDRFEKVAFIWSTFSSDSCFPSALSGRSVCASLAVTAYRHGGGKKRRFLGLFFSPQLTVLSKIWSRVTTTQWWHVWCSDEGLLTKGFFWFFFIPEVEEHPWTCLSFIMLLVFIYVVMWAKKIKAIVNYFLEQSAAAKVIGNCLHDHF